ncbi:MAG: AraC family transcriptional regulator [Spirochaetales bacterium]|nr:AraC family transcriptional regulator [Spirochaetales bacterium]
MQSTLDPYPLSFSCEVSGWRDGEQFVSLHCLTYLVKGELLLDDGHTRTLLKEGDLFFCRKNQLLRFRKPQEKVKDFKTVTLFFAERFLGDFANEYPIRLSENVAIPTVQRIENNIIKSFMDSLQAYEPFLATPSENALVPLKLREALLLMLQHLPQYRSILFDFSNPVKKDLSTFMEKNFHFNVPLERFALLTGRSLTSFKRDFKAIYGESPARWIIRKRLESAYEMITQQEKTAVEIYQDLGFRDLSHFSYAFKKQYGLNASQVKKNR